MVRFPNCKINLGLNVLRKREDGFHDLETIFYPLAFRDALEIIVNPDHKTGVAFSQSGFSIGGKEEDNLCIRAYHLLKKDFPQVPGIKMHLHKVIPTGSGLGGGSGDGAFTLQMLNEKFQLNIASWKLQQYATELGSDCPFFIINKPCFASGRGELLDPLPIDLSPYSIILANPGIHVDTAWAFTQVRPVLPGKSIIEITAQPIETWKDELRNDFEEPVFKKYPLIHEIRDGFYDKGAIYASMSGSGSTVFGIFEKEKKPTLFPGKDHILKIL